MNNIFIFVDKTEDEQTLLIDLSYVGTVEVCKDDHTITLQFTKSSMGQIVSDYSTWEDCSDEFLRLTAQIQIYHDEMNSLGVIFLDENDLQ